MFKMIKSAECDIEIWQFLLKKYISLHANMSA